MKKKIVWIIVGTVLSLVTISGCVYLFYYNNINADTDLNLSSSDSGQELFGRILLSDISDILDNITITQNSPAGELAKFKDELVKKVLEDAKKLAGSCGDIRGSITVIITTEKSVVGGDDYTLIVEMKAYLFKAKNIKNACTWKRYGKINISMVQFCHKELIGDREFYCQDHEFIPSIGSLKNRQVIFRETIPIPGSGQPPAKVCCSPTPTTTQKPTLSPSATVSSTTPPPSY